MHSIPEIYTDERLWVAEYLNTDREQEVSLARCRVEPGVVTQCHRLTVDEWYIIESGQGDMNVGHQWQPVTAGDSIHIPAGCDQQIKNTGQGDLIFFCLCRPRFTPECYSAT